jgi:hypothetical protein
MPPETIAVPRRSQNSGVSGLRGSKITASEEGQRSSSSLHPDGDRTTKHLFIHPAKQGPVQVDQLLSRYVREDRASLSLDHEIPHCRHCGLASALIRYLGVVGNEMKFPTTVTEAALFNFMGAQGELAGYGRCALHPVAERTRGTPPGTAARRAPEM